MFSFYLFPYTDVYFLYINIHFVIFLFFYLHLHLFIYIYNYINYIFIQNSNKLTKLIAG